jgi:hypothetical protein
MGICGGNRLWDDWEGFSGRGHLSTRDEAPSKDGAFMTFLFTEPNHSTERKLSEMIKNGCPRGMFG